MIYQYKPHPNDPQAAALPYGLRLRVIPGTLVILHGEGYPQSTVQVKDTAGNPLGRVLFQSLEVMK
jgi:hypothetical protein